MIDIFNDCCSLFEFLVADWALSLMLEHIATKQYGRHAQV